MGIKRQGKRSQRTERMVYKGGGGKGWGEGKRDAREGGGVGICDKEAK